MKPSSDSFIYFWFDQYLLSTLESWYIKKKTMNIVENNRKEIHSLVMHNAIISDSLIP